MGAGRIRNKLLFTEIRVDSGSAGRSVIHRAEDKVELIRLSLYTILLKRPGTPGIYAADSLLDEVEIHPGPAV